MALLATLGTEPFLSDTIKGILRTGVEPDQIHVGCPENARASIRSTARQYSGQIRVTLIENSAQSTPTESYSSFGSQQFNGISWMKILFIRQLLRDFEHVIYSDLDVIWLRNPIPYLIQVAQAYPLAFQTEGQPRFPPAVCAGFVSLRRSSRTTTFIDGLIELRQALSKDERIDDQGACQRLIETNSGWLRDIFMLPEALFPNGLGYRSMLDQPCEPTADGGRSRAVSVSCQLDGRTGEQVSVVGFDRELAGRRDPASYSNRTPTRSRGGDRRQ
ncbi:MAG: putative nucleotide-diphospho-sugar transferase [Bradyrhizobium sp.]|uniref:putative nucleotide-diphospho-sugar transferase n=1 Tax=Bradyrhizobium sp. TaxID=376 RepID=UPI003D0CD708